MPKKTSLPVTPESIPQAEAVLPEKGEKTKFFMYRGLPLVRNKDTLYYGNMYDPYVVMLQIMGKEKQNGIEVAKSVQLYKMATDEKLSPIEAIVKKGQRNSLYEAVDMAYVWLMKSEEI